MEIGKQIKNYRNEIGITQDELAEKIFVSRQTISNWENNKNYPDLKSLILLSSLFNISLDILIKGDIQEMKEIIKTEDIQKFKHESNIFSVLMISMILFFVPLIKFGGYVGLIVWILLCTITIYYAFRVEKLKKKFDIQTYKEILAFTENKHLDKNEKSFEYVKRPYQKILLAAGAGLLTIIIFIIMGYIFNLY